MKVALYVGKGKTFNRLIRLVQKWKGFKYWQVSHCEVVLQDLGDGFYLCGSSSVMDDGVRTKLINLRNGNWVIQGCEGGEAAALDWLKNNNGKQYDFGGAFKTVLRFLRNSADRWFCSEVCAKLLGLDGAPMPAELAEIVWAEDFNNKKVGE